MLRLLLFLALIQRVTSECPDSDSIDILHDGVCTGKIDYCRNCCNCCGSKPRCEFDQCAQQTKNSNIMMKPVIIRNDEEQEYWTSKSQEQRTLIALVCNLGTSAWEWYDGSFVAYKPLNNYDSLLDQNCSDYREINNWYYHWYIRDDGHWYSYNTDKYNTYCVGQLPPLPNRDSCDIFTGTDGENLCYEVISTPVNWQAAQNACGQKGAALASIHFQEASHHIYQRFQNEFVRALAASKGVMNGIYLGSSTFRYNESQWADDSPWDYDNLYPDESPLSGEGDCLVLDTFSATGQWRGADCSSKLPYVCVRPDSASMCTAGPWKEGETITSPGYPYDASVACDYLLTVAPGKFVQVQIDDLEANSCCDKLILADDTIGSPLIAKLNGQITAKKPAVINSKSNVMRVSWQPKGGVNVKGFKMTYRAVDTPDEGPLTTTHITSTGTTHTYPTTIRIQLTTPLPESSSSSTSTTTSITPRSSTMGTTTTSGAAHKGATLTVLAVMSSIFFY